MCLKQYYDRVQKENTVNFLQIRVRLDWTRSNAKQPKFDVIDSSRKVSRAVDDVKFWLLRVASRPV